MFITKITSRLLHSKISNKTALAQMVSPRRTPARSRRERREPRAGAEPCGGRRTDGARSTPPSCTGCTRRVGQQNEGSNGSKRCGAPAVETIREDDDVEHVASHHVRVELLKGGNLGEVCVVEEEAPLFRNISDPGDYRA